MPISLLATLFAFLLISSAGAGPQEPPLESGERLTAAAEAFAATRIACAEDGGTLWGRDLWAPFMLVDPATRRFIANEPIVQADPAAGVTVTTPVEVDGEMVHVGSLPPNFSVANTATDYAGRRWAMAVWPIGDTVEARRQLLCHELWHRIQDDLGVPLDTPACEHLDEEQGRLWLRMEMRALAAALRAGDDSARRLAMEDALAFREHRRSLFDGSGARERKLELAEGLAEYTGLRLSGRADRNGWAADNLEKAEQGASFVRSFPYSLGPAYGLLLDAAAPDWRGDLDASQDLGSLLAAALRAEREPGRGAVGVDQRGQRYGIEAVRERERRLAEERAARRRQLIASLVEGPVLEVPMADARVSFDPGAVTPLPPHGTIYSGATLTQEPSWTLEAPEADLLIAADWKAAFVPMPQVAETSADGRTVQGAGWTLRLEPGWRIVEAEAGRRWKLQRSGPG